MKITYVGHACVLVESRGHRILFDPWWMGSAYCDQWYPFPRPSNEVQFADVDTLLITHGHEDHLHPPTLRNISKSATVLCAHGWYAGMDSYLRSVGFHCVTEAVSHRSHEIAPGIIVTFISNNLDNIIVIESEGEVFVNVNDALHAHHASTIDAFVAHIKHRWPKIDYVFCGYGGASYFPNCLHLPDKNDVEIGEMRERLLAHNFCRIVAGLSPKTAVPFAADFVLLDDDKRWINDIRVPRRGLLEHYTRHFAHLSPDVSLLILNSGDVLSNGELQPHSESPNLDDGSEQRRCFDNQYRDVAHQRALRRKVPLAPADAAVLQDRLLAHLANRAAELRRPRLEGLEFSLRLSNVERRGCFVISFPTLAPKIQRAERPSSQSCLTIDMWSGTLTHSLDSTWGGDALTIGYGLDIHVKDSATIEQRRDVSCVRLLTRHPTASRHMLAHPSRALAFLSANPLTRKWALSRLWPSKRSEIAATYDARLWLLRSKCEICEICDFPMPPARSASTHMPTHS